MLRARSTWMERLSSSFFRKGPLLRTPPWIDDFCCNDSLRRRRPVNSANSPPHASRNLEITRARWAVDRMRSLANSDAKRITHKDAFRRDIPHDWLLWHVSRHRDSRCCDTWLYARFRQQRNICAAARDVLWDVFPSAVACFSRITITRVTNRRDCWDIRLHHRESYSRVHASETMRGCLVCAIGVDQIYYPCSRNCNVIDNVIKKYW